MGDAVNTAARLQAAAPPEGVLVGKETRAASARAISYEAVEPILAKGKEEPLPAWLARAATSAPAERPVSAAPFIGRDAELELLVRTWARTSGELHPQLVTLVGAPGIGKTRLTLEFAARVQSAGGRILRGRPLPYGEPAAYWAFGAVIREACGIFATDSADVAADKLGRARGIAASRAGGAGAGEESLDPGPSRRGHGGRPAGSVRLRSAVSRGPRPRAAHLGGARGSALGGRRSSGTHRGALARGSGTCRCCCSRLPDPSSWTRDRAGLVSRPISRCSSRRSPKPTPKISCGELSSGAPDREAVAERVEEAAGGNPLFIEELAAWLSEGGAANAVGLPANIKTIIAARLDQLPAAERQVILDASVIGDFFWQGTPRSARKRRRARGDTARARAPGTRPPQPYLAYPR